MLGLRLGFLLLLYLFLFSILLAIKRDLRQARLIGEDEPAGAGRPGTEGLLVLDGGSTELEAGHAFRLRPVTTIGRSAENEVQLRDTFVSSRHARLRHREGRWFLADLGTTNGTLLNNGPIEGEQMVEPGDIIQIGTVRLKLTP